MEFLNGTLSFAPAGADPSDTSAWTEIGHAEPVAVLDADEFVADEQITTWDGAVVRSIATEAKEVEVEAVNRDLLLDLFGLADRETAIQRDMRIFLATERYALTIPRAHMRRFTPLEREGEWARRTVRHGLADVLEWLREPVGPDPDAAYTDDLWKATVLPFHPGGIA